MCTTGGYEESLAGLLAREVARGAARQPVREYIKARVTACQSNATSAALTRAGAGDVPGAADFYASSRSGRTAAKFASLDGKAMFEDPEVDADHIADTLRSQIEMQRLHAPDAKAEQGFDAAAMRLLEATGYDSGAVERAISLLDVNAQERRDAVRKAAKPGKQPELPRQLKWPKR
jgi:hypothetical protein